MGPFILMWGMDERMKGPIVYVQDRGAIFYETSLMGDADACGLVVIGTDYFESRKLLLNQLEKGVKGRDLDGEYVGIVFDLSEGVQEVDISEKEFMRTERTAKIAYQNLDFFRNSSMKIMFNLEKIVGRKEINGEIS